MPKRIQMTRQRPWRTDNPDAVIVARPSKWGNPFRVERAGSCHVSTELTSQWRNGPHWHTVWPEGASWCYPTAAEAAARAVEVLDFRIQFAPDEVNYPTQDEIRAELAGRDLACWCPLDQPCHADVLLELANA